VGQERSSRNVRVTSGLALTPDIITAPGAAPKLGQLKLRTGTPAELASPRSCAGASREPSFLAPAGPLRSM